MEYHFSDRISNVRPSAIREILKYAASHPEVIALSTGSPANEAVPVEEISEISARIFKEKPLAGLQYSMTEGYPALRESTRQRLKKEFGIGREFDDLIITTGGQQGLSLTPNIFCNPGDTVVVESWASRWTKRAWSWLGLSVPSKPSRTSSCSTSFRRCRIPAAKP